MKIFVTHSSDIDVKTDLYDPIRNSDFNAQHEIKLPQEFGKETITKEMIQSQDLIIAESSMPSTGSGIELGWADMYGVPIVNIYKKGSKSSSSMRYVTDVHIEYIDTEDMITKLRDYINNHIIM
ncbi:hypothetical protein KC901_03310 [Patescibacteria group bacterium]|nr:hypothetical protein [Patescibacteria group bacterium]